MYRPRSTLPGAYNGRVLVDEQYRAMLQMFSSNFDYLLADEDDSGGNSDALDALKYIARCKVVDAIKLSNKTSEVSGKMKEILKPIAAKYDVPDFMVAWLDE